MKSKVTINVDTLILEEAKLYNINISSTTEEALRSNLAIQKGNVNGINKQILMVKIKKKEAEITKNTSELMVFRENLKKINEIEEKKQEEILEKEKKKVQKRTHCQNCGKFIEKKTKHHDFPIGKICNHCFLSSNSISISKWNQRN